MTPPGAPAVAGPARPAAPARPASSSVREGRAPTRGRLTVAIEPDAEQRPLVADADGAPLVGLVAVEPHAAHPASVHVAPLVDAEQADRRIARRRRREREA